MVDFMKVDRGVRMNWSRAFWWNCVKNHPWIEREYNEGKPWFDGLGRFPRKMPALVLGSGSSIEKAIPHLHNWKGVIFAGPTQARMLDYADRLPEYMVCIDASKSQWEKLKIARPTWLDTILITNPQVDPEVIQGWEGRRSYFKPADTEDYFLTTVLPQLYPWIPNSIPNSGCNTNTMMIIADLINCSPIITLGYDLGFTNNQERAQNYEVRGNFNYWPTPPVMLEGELDTLGKPFQYEEGLPDIKTTNTNLFYKLISLGLWKTYDFHWIDASDGVITEVPKMDIEDVIKGQVIANKTGELSHIQGAPKKPDYKQICKIVDGYLAKRGCRLEVPEARKNLGYEFPDRVKGQVENLKNQLNYLEEKLSHWTLVDGKWNWTQE
jgi:hypothetical protein|tara:strand:+ start:3196 stop:4338 length:1143 start_codon:yes stop_codon:yes gene_type:complete